MLRVGARLQWYATARIDLDQGAAGSRQASQGKPRTTSCTHCCHRWHPPSMLAAANPSLPFPRVAASIKRSRAGSAPVTENSEQDDGEPTGKAKHCRECTPAFIAQRLWTSNKQAIRSYPSGDGPCLTDARPMVAWLRLALAISAGDRTFSKITGMFAGSSRSASAATASATLRRGVAMELGS